MGRAQSVEEHESESRWKVPEDQWDAGNLGCGELALGLFFRVKAISPGGIFRLVAHDPAAPEDLPAWCRMTGHKLVRAVHPEYLIERKEN